MQTQRDLIQDLSTQRVRKHRSELNFEPYIGVVAVPYPNIEAGVRIGRWTVQDSFMKTAKGEKKWLCRCDCGTQRHVLERSLRHGGSMSCGCMRREEAVRAVGYDLTGQTFGDLTVLFKAEKQRKNGGIWWTCQCACGNRYDVSASLLVTGRRTHCTGKTHPKGYSSIDITNRRFSRLVALYPLETRDTKGTVFWHCRCDCGHEVDVSYNNLVYGNTKSCGCQKKEHDKKLGSFLTRVDGTSIDMLRSKKVPSDNTTGYKGVYLIRGKYAAKIVFKKKAYYLGTYDRIEDAAEARKEAEEVLFDGVAEHYARWKVRADAEPVWGVENPVQVLVSQDSVSKRISVICLPEV